MSDAPRALWGDLPHVERQRHEVLGRQRRLVGKPLASSLLRTASSIEPAFARDHHTLGEIAQHGVRRAAKRSPRTRAARALALLPDDLAAEQQPESVLQDRDDVGREAAIGLAPEVGDVDRDAAAGLELANALGEHVVQQLEVLDVRARHPFLLELLLVVLAGEVRRRRDDQRDRAVVELVHRTGIATHERVGDRLRWLHLVVRRQLGRLEAFVEGGRVVALSPSHPEVRRGCRSSFPHPPPPPRTLMGRRPIVGEWTA